MPRGRSKGRYQDDVSVLSEDKSQYSRARSVGSRQGRSRSRRVNMNPFKALGRRAKAGPDDISISDSLCSGILRGEMGVGNSLSSTTKSNRTVGTSVTGPGSMADFSRELSELNNQSFNSNNNFSTEEAAKREDRKQRVKEKLENYKKEQKQLKETVRLLERQLAATTEKLKEVDSEAAAKIGTLEIELHDTRHGLKTMAVQSTKEVTDQSEVIKQLGKKLVRQAHVIKRQKDAVNEYKIQMQAMHEEMEMQDERDSKMELSHTKLKQDYDRVQERTEQMQNMLSENIEEMTNLKQETERDAKSIMELEFNLQQKDATLERVAKESSEKAKLICKLQEELDEKTNEADTFAEELKASEADADKLREDLKATIEESEELQCKFASWGQGPRNSSSNLNRQSSGISRQQSGRLALLRRQGREDSSGEIDVLEAELQAKEATIQNLDCTIKEHEETIAALRSEQVKMSSTFKQDSYLKRKEIAKLKQANAEYALKLRSLEKAFKGVSATEINNSLHGMSLHTGALRGNTGLRLNSSMHSSSLNGSSQHSVTTKEDKAAALHARLGGIGGLKPYYPTQQNTNASGKDESSVQGSDDGRKGEKPEEC